MEAKQCATKQPVDHWEKQKGNKIPGDKWKQKHDDPKPMGCSRSTSTREVYSNSLTSGKRKISKQPNLAPKGTGEKRTKSTASRRKEILKILAEINEKQMKKTIEKMNETKSWFFENIKLIKLFQEKMGESSSQ